MPSTIPEVFYNTSLPEVVGSPEKSEEVAPIQDASKPVGMWN